MNKVKKVCNYCGSDDVRKDAWAKWDEDKQEWVLADIYDHEYCMTCDDETGIENQEYCEEEG